jgi:hypothetical protein
MSGCSLWSQLDTSWCFVLLLLGVREMAGLNLDEERRYPEEILLNTLSRNADWAMSWKVRGSNPGTGYRLFVSPKHPDICDALCIV